MHHRGTMAATSLPPWRLAVGALLLSGAAFACVVSDALTGPQTAAVVLRYTGDTVVVVGDTVAFAFTADIEGTPVSGARFRYIIDDSTVVARSVGNDSLIGRRRGRTRLTASLESPLVSRPSSLTVTLDVVVASVSVAPSSDTLVSLGDTLVLSAPAFDAHGGVVSDCTPAWSSSDTTIAVFVAPGRLVARGNGQVLVRAVVDRDTGTAGVLVQQRLSGLSLSPATLVLQALTAEANVVATGTDARGYAMLGVAVTWTSVAPSIATVSAGGRVRAVDNGTTRLLAQSGAVQDTLTVIVEQEARMISILPDPPPAIVALGDQIAVTATATDSLGFVVAVPNKTVGWATLDPAIATVDRNGLVAGVGVGTGRIIAVMDAARDTVPVQVGDLPASVDLQPPLATLASVQDTLLLSVAVRNSRGNLIQNPGVSWRTTDAAIVRVDSVPGPLAIAVSKGTARVIASAGSVADTSFVTVTNAPVFLDISATGDTLTSIWDSLPIPAVILNARGDTLASSAVQWSSDAPLVGSVTPSGLVVALDTGLALVRAKYGVAPGDTLRDSIAVRVFNLPAALVLSGDRDTLTAIGQSLGYSGEVRNARGNPIPGYTIAWSSSNSSAITVSPAGVITSASLGLALIIGQAGGVADTIVGVVVNPTRLIVDNGIQIAPRFGTLKRPYARIQDGVNAADLDDTVLVHKGTASYAETVALNRRVTLLGDDSAFAASVPRDPLLLPLLAHDTGSAGITVYTPATVVIKNFALRHTIGGPAIDARQADLRVAGFFVNPPGTVTGRVGRGIALDSSTVSSATITSSDIRSVRGYGILVRNSAGVLVDSVFIDTIDSIPGSEPGAGVRIVRGSANTVRHATIRGTQGPGIFVDSSAGATLASNDLAGRQRLLLLRASNSATIQTNSIDTRPAGGNGEVFSGGTLFEWAGLEIQSSSQVVVTGNSFRDAVGANQEPFNAMRFVTVRNPSFPFQPGAQISANRVIGNRAGIRSDSSNLSIQSTRFDSTLTGVVGTGNDVLTLQNDTVHTTLQGSCVRATSASSVTLTNSWFQHCTVGASHAVAVTNGIFRVQQSTFLENRAAVAFTGTSVTAQGNAISGTGFSPISGDTLMARAALEATAAIITIVQNSVTDHSLNAGLRVEGGSVSARIDSNFVSNNARGVLFGSLSSLSVRDNDIFDNAPAGALNEASPSVSLPTTWWGDARGPRGLADPTATGDSIVGNANVSGWNLLPRLAGTIAAAARSVRGDAQTAPRGTTLPRTFVVRVVDAAGKPVAGVLVTFKVTGGAGSFGGSGQVKITTNESGLAEAALTLGATPGANTATATAPGTNTLTFTATGT